MITRPLDLESHLSPPPRDLTPVAWVNVAMIALFFSLLGSRFVLAPGLLIGLGDDGFALPTTAGLQNSRTAPVVVSYRQDDVIMIDAEIVKLSELRQRLEAYARQHPGEVLLLRADRRVSTQAFAELSAMAHAAGFAYVHMAGEPQAAANAPK